ncbi:hypothetical protein BH10ACI2_BH10ACI2_10560 [soil metagenome]
MNRFLALALMLTVLVTGAVPQDPTETQQKMRELVEKRDHHTLIDELQKIKSAEPKTFAAKNFDYLLARAAESSGALATAMASYQAVVTRDSELKPWALKHLSQIARSTGNLMLERLYLEEIRVDSENSILAYPATDRQADNSFESGNYSETMRLLTATGSPKLAPATRNGSRESRELFAEASLRKGETELARTIFDSLIKTVANPAQPDDIARKAAEKLDLIDVGGTDFGKKVGNLTEAEHLQRAGIYQFYRDFANAKLHYEALIGINPAGPNSADAALQIGRGFAQQADFVKALEWFERVLERYPQSPAAKDALLQVASAYSRVGKPREAVKRYQTFIDRYPADDKLDRAYLNLVDILRDQSEDNEALKWCAKTETAFKGKVAEAVAIFTEARIYIARSEWPNALARLDNLKNFTDLGGINVPGGTSMSEVVFLRGYVLEQMKRYPEAIDVYLSIPYGLGDYYGWRSTLRLKELSKDDGANSFITQRLGVSSSELRSKDMELRKTGAEEVLRLTDSPALRENATSVLKAAMKTSSKFQPPAFKLVDKFSEQSAASPHMSIAHALIALGLFDEAAPEIEAAYPDTLKSVDDRAYTLASYYRFGDGADHSIAFIEPIWQKLPPGLPAEIVPRDQLELLYPIPYADDLLRFAPQRGIDPRFLLSIMRQESRFRSDARSNAAARGLMQFIATTSGRVAGELGIEGFDQNDIYFPRTSILFGSQYLADLFKAFPNQPDAVAASYNGGDDNMKRWYARSRSNLPERYVPEILYAQSKDYVYKVMSNYRMYQYLYDENLRPKP